MADPLLQFAISGSEALLRFALEEYTRTLERARLAVAEAPARRDKAERDCRAWLSIVLRLGHPHPDAGPWLDETPILPGAGVERDKRLATRTIREADGGGVQASDPDPTLIAHRIAPLESVHAVLSRYRDHAFAVALGHPEPWELAQASGQEPGRRHDRAAGISTPGGNSAAGGCQKAQEAGAAWQRFEMLKTLARRLNCWTPVSVRPEQSRPQAEQSKGPEAKPMEQAA